MIALTFAGAVLVLFLALCVGFGFLIYWRLNRW